MASLTRRDWLTGSVAAGTVAALPKAVLAVESEVKSFDYCLNTSTVRTFEGENWGKSRGIVELIDIASKAGYRAIEPWVAELDAYIAEGGTTKELGQRFADAGLAVPDVIGFVEWVVADDARRAKGLDQAKRTFALIAEVGGKRMAAPPVGATGGGSRRDDPKASAPVTDLLAAAGRYRALLDLGKSLGVTPIVEVWGFSKTFSRLGETLLVAAECGVKGGCVLPDVYHLYKGGSDFTGLGVVGSEGIGIFHANDYPDIDRATIADADRVFPGDGVAPLKDVFATLRAIGYRGYVSLELFNRDYWKRDPHEVAKEGLAKLKAVAER